MAVNNVVFVHGAWADGSGWGSVQLPLTSVAADLAATRRVLTPQGGATLLVGHPYAGVVITEAGNAPNVAALASVAAFDPEEGHVMVDDVNIRHRDGPPSASDQAGRARNSIAVPVWTMLARSRSAISMYSSPAPMPCGVGP